MAHRKLGYVVVTNFEHVRRVWIRHPKSEMWLAVPRVELINFPDCSYWFTGPATKFVMKPVS